LNICHSSWINCIFVMKWWIHSTKSWMMSPTFKWVQTMTALQILSQWIEHSIFDSLHEHCSNLELWWIDLIWLALSWVELNSMEIEIAGTVIVIVIVIDWANENWTKMKWKLNILSFARWLFDFVSQQKWKSKQKWTPQMFQQQMIPIMQFDFREIKQFINLFEIVSTKCEIHFVIHLLSIFIHVIHQKED
jgi:hypothetical protein